MEAIINIEDRLREIKAVFELSLQAEIFPDEIFIDTTNTIWDQKSSFRAECLSLSSNDQACKKTLQTIYELCNNIMELYCCLKQHIVQIDRNYWYRVEYHHLIGNFLIRRKIISENLSEDCFQPLDGSWYTYMPLKNDSSKLILTNPLFLIIFVEQIHDFLENRILIRYNIPVISKAGIPELSLTECFRDINYFNELLKNPRLMDHFELLENGHYHWTSNINLLSGLAFRLLHRNKLIDCIQTGPHLAKVFCPFFGIKVQKDNKTFRPSRAIIEPFNWIS